MKKNTNIPHQIWCNINLLVHAAGGQPGGSIDCN